MGCAGVTLSELNLLSEQQAVDFFLTCCGSAQWAKRMTARRPFNGFDELAKIAEEVWFSLPADDWKEAFAHHPRIGGINKLREKFQNTAPLALKEQAGIAGASEETLHALADGNAAYEAKFGYIFIVCATGKSADEMLTILRQRLENQPHEEIMIAAEEQAKITRVRLEKLLN